MVLVEPVRHELDLEDCIINIKPRGMCGFSEINTREKAKDGIHTKQGAKVSEVLETTGNLQSPATLSATVLVSTSPPHNVFLPPPVLQKYLFYPYFLIEGHFQHNHHQQQQNTKHLTPNTK